MTTNETIKNLLTKDISSKGISKEAAKSIMDAIYAAQQDNELKIELSHIKESMATKADLNVFKSELKADIAKLDIEIVEIKTDLKWIRYALYVIIPAILGAAIKVIFFNN